MNKLRPLLNIVIGIIFGYTLTHYLLIDGLIPARQIPAPQPQISELDTLINYPTIPVFNYSLPSTLNISTLPITSQYTRQKAPILMYHHIKDPLPNANSTEINLDVRPANFDLQLTYLAQNGFQAVSLQDYTNALKNRRLLPKGTFVITFDDGYDDVYQNALPIMQKYHFTATLFLIVNDLNKPGYLKTSQVMDLLNSGFEIGSHTLTHPNLTNTSLINAQKEIYTSRSILEKNFNVPIESFCYPSGEYNNDIITIVKAGGYIDAVTTNEANTNSSTNLYYLNRVRVRGNDTLATFKSKINAPIPTTTPTPTKNP